MAVPTVTVGAERLDLDDPRAHFGQDGGGARPSYVGGQFEDGDTGERHRGVRVSRGSIDGRERSRSTCQKPEISQ
jgi:hypothetical protein